MSWLRHLKYAKKVCLRIAPLLPAVCMVLFRPYPSAGEEGDFPMFRGDYARSGYLAEGPEPPLELLWTFKTRMGADEIDAYPGVDDGLSPATIVDGVVYVGGYDGWVYALEASTGKQKWDFSTGGRVNSTPTYAEGMVIFGSMDGNIYALDADNGSLLWKYALGSSVFRMITYYGARASPAVRDGTVYIGA